MKRKFNTTGLCNPKKHYMVDLTEKLVQIKEMVDEGNYFTINRARQYGKTTILSTLRRYLANDYLVASISFQGWGDFYFENEENFCQILLRHISKALLLSEASMDYAEKWIDETVITFNQLSVKIDEMCKSYDIVLLIDEVDKTSNNRVFLQFLGVLRQKYLNRLDDIGFTFQSVILAGVYDIKNIKLKMINDGIYLPSDNETYLRNSPWNIASEFNVRMSFTAAEISTMLWEYENDYGTGMNIENIAQEIYAYTFGYPYMVSRLCQLLHLRLNANWSLNGLHEAIVMLLKEDNELFRDMSKNLENNEELFQFIYGIVILGLRRTFTYDNPTMDLAKRYGYIKFDQSHSISMFNRIFATRITDYFISKNELSHPHHRTSILYHQIVTANPFNMELCLVKFAQFFNREIFPMKEKQLLEIQYRISFLSFLKPLLNGVGHYHYESQLANETRMNLIVNYGNEEYIIELKRIFSARDRKDGIIQLLDYMELRGAATGYYLTFDFRKKSKSKVEWLNFANKKILEIGV